MAWPRTYWVATLLTTVACGAALWAFAMQEYFYADDWQSFALVHERGLSWSLLREGYFGTFAPGHRLLDWIVAGLGDASFGAALGVLLAFYVGSVVVFAALAQALVADRRWALVATLLFAAAVPNIRTFQWFASGGHVVPSIFFTLVALWAGVRWFAGHRLRWAAVAGLAEAAALCFYSKPLLTLAYLPALRVLVLLPRGQGLRGALRVLLSDWPLWLAIGAPAAAYLIIYASPD
jgi:hypothetical protein